jgi:hypothetical protein
MEIVTMITHHWRIALMALAGSLLLAGCSHEQARQGGATARTTERPAARATAQESHGTRTRGTHSTHTQTTRPGEAAESGRDTAELPTRTGIPACDDYLASYKGCHRAAGIYAPGQLEGRYEAMRTSLLRDSQDPDIRPQLANRCNSLASQLRQALHGRACDVEPASTSTTPSD